MSYCDSVPKSAVCAPNWQSQFLDLLPQIERHARWAFRRLSPDHRQEGVQSVIVYAFVEYGRLVTRGRAHLGYATSLARFGVKQHRAGRRVGGQQNVRDLAAQACQRRQGFAIESLDSWRLFLVDDRRASPAELATLRVDFENWLKSLTPRRRQVASVLAAGEPTSSAARLFCVSRGRISQLRRQLFESWQQFIGEPATT